MRDNSHTQRTGDSSSAPRTRRVKIDQELIDDQKFQEKIERKLFIERIEREANDALLCPGCFNANWKMHHKYWISITENSLLATMICRKCKRKLPFATQLEPDEDEAEEDEEEDEGPPFGMFGFGSKTRRRRGPDFDQRLRLLAHYH